jgi:3-oxoacyl-[acyl-carrier protein] reductase
MLERKSGKIINIASGAGISGMPRCVHYGASKAAIIAFTKGLSKEVIGSGINVNAVAPGVGDTKFLITGEFPEGEIDRAVATVPTRRSPGRWSVRRILSTAVTPRDIRQNRSMLFEAGDALEDSE